MPQNAAQRKISCFSATRGLFRAAAANSTYNGNVGRDNTSHSTGDDFMTTPLTMPPTTPHRAPRRELSAGRRAPRRGVAVLEFAFVVPVLLLVMLGIMEFGWYARTQLTIANAAREGARAASIGKTQSQIKNRVIFAATPVVVTTDDITLEQSLNSGSVYERDFPADNTTKTPAQNGVQPGNLIRVTVSVAYRRLVNLPITPSRITARVTMLRER